jgi:thioredoxin 1
MSNEVTNSVASSTAVSVACSEANFQAEVLDSSIPVLVKFATSWCTQCRALDAMLKQILPEYEGRVKFATVDVEAEEALRDKFQILSVPVIHLYKKGELAAKKVGMISRKDLLELFSTALA